MNASGCSWCAPQLASPCTHTSQNEVKVWKEKARRKALIVARQEDELAERETALSEALKELSALTGALEGARDDEARSAAERADLRAKLDESKAQLVSNEQMIRWLNQQVTEAQLGGGNGGALAAPSYAHRALALGPGSSHARAMPGLLSAGPSAAAARVRTPSAGMASRQLDSYGVRASVNEYGMNGVACSAAALTAPPAPVAPAPMASPSRFESVQRYIPSARPTPGDLTTVQPRQMATSYQFASATGAQHVQPVGDRNTGGATSAHPAGPPPSIQRAEPASAFSKAFAPSGGIADVSGARDISGARKSFHGLAETHAQTHDSVPSHTHAMHF
eukprot:365431-Chlamydomonas_euryale.AAC.21